MHTIDITAATTTITCPEAGSGEHLWLTAADHTAECFHCHATAH